MQEKSTCRMETQKKKVEKKKQNKKEGKERLKKGGKAEEMI